MQPMQRTPHKEFEPGLGKRLEELWGTPPNLYRALANHPAIVAESNCSSGGRNPLIFAPSMSVRSC